MDRLDGRGVAGEQAMGFALPEVADLRRPLDGERRTGHHPVGIELADLQARYPLSALSGMDETQRLDTPRAKPRPFAGRLLFETERDS